MIDWLRIFEHLLPRDARALSLMPRAKPVAEWFEGMTGLPEDGKDIVDQVWQAVDPQDTPYLENWEESFAIQFVSAMTEQERRDRLDAVWKAVGGQSPRYIEDTLRARGFDVYVHDWWEEPAADPPVPRDPNDFIDDGSGTPIAYHSSESIAPFNQHGQAHMMYGRQTDPPGYLLVNDVTTVVETIVQHGNPTPQHGTAQFGTLLDVAVVPKVWSIPTNDPPDYQWHYFWYVGGETFPDLAQVPGARRKEFEHTLRQLSPAHLWIGVLVEYTS